MVAYHDDEWGAPVPRRRRAVRAARARVVPGRAVVVDDPAQARGVPGRVPRASIRRSWPPSTRPTATRLMADAGIVRNGAKIDATIGNAAALPGDRARSSGRSTRTSRRWCRHRPRACRRRASAGDIPATTPVSDALSADLKRRGFRFVGSTIVYAFMQSVGLVDDHLPDCFRYRRLTADAAQRSRRSNHQVAAPSTSADPDDRPDRRTAAAAASAA